MGYERSEMQRSEIRDAEMQRSEIRDQRSEIRDQRCRDQRSARPYA
jgi:hypothetical protein